MAANKERNCVREYFKDSMMARNIGMNQENADMNYFVEGLQGSGKSTLVQKLSDMNPGYTAVREGE